MNALIAKAEGLLRGEPLRAIVYGAAVVIWIVVGLANAAGVNHFGPTLSLTDAMVDATAAAAALTEISRRFVFSPTTVAAIQDEASEPTPAAPLAGVATWGLRVAATESESAEASTPTSSP